MVAAVVDGAEVEVDGAVVVESGVVESGVVESGVDDPHAAATGTRRSKSAKYRRSRI
jgi:hypothetical protein